MSTSTLRDNGTGAMALRPTAFEVASETNPSQTYRVQLPDCECKDFRYRRANPPAVITSLKDLFCKHLLQGLRVAGWQLPTEPVDGLSADEVFETIVRLGIGRHAADEAVSSARTFRSSRITVGRSVVVITYDRIRHLFTIALP